jgi:hypothetical protein
MVFVDHLSMQAKMLVVSYVRQGAKIACPMQGTRSPANVYKKLLADWLMVLVSPHQFCSG